MSYPYSKEEEDWLETNAETANIHALYRKHRIASGINNWPKRTKQGLRKALNRRKFSVSATIDGWNYSGFATYLNTDWHRVKGWCTRGLLASTKIKHFYQIKTQDFQDFARQHPELLVGIEAEYLRALLSEEEISKIPKYPDQTNRNFLAIQRTDTGEIFKDTEAAAKDAGYAKQYFLRLLRNGELINGVSYVKIFKM